MKTWPVATLAELGQWRGGGTPSKSNPAFWDQGDIPWLSPKDMGPETLVGTMDAITQSALQGSSVRLVEAGSVAVVVRSGILERTLPVAVVPFETTLNQDMKALIPHDHVDPRWVAWALRSRESWLLANTRKAGTTVASLNWKKFLAAKIPLPSIDVQRRVTEVLEGHLSRLNAGDQYAASALRRSFVLQQELLSQQFSSHEGEATILGAIASWGSGGTPSARVASYYEEGSIPWVNSGDLDDADIADAPKKITELGLAESSAKWVPSGSVLVAMYGATIGKTGLTCAPVTTNQAIAFATPKARVAASWLQWYLRSQRRALRAAGQGGAQPNISQTVLKAWPVVVPSPEQQAKQVAACQESESQVQALQTAVAAASSRSSALRRALLDAAFSGRLTGAASDMDRVEELINA